MGWPRRLTARTARRQAVLECVACAAILSHTFVSVACRAALRRYVRLDKYIAMRLFQSLDASHRANIRIGECLMARLLKIPLRRKKKKGAIQAGAPNGLPFMMPVTRLELMVELLVHTYILVNKYQ
jgi:hypothetical protein